MLRIVLPVVIGPVLVLSILFGAMVVIGVVPSGTTAQDTDAARIAALETQVAKHVEINWIQNDLIAGLIGSDDRLLPPPRPASDFGASQYTFSGLSDNAITLFCRANSEMDDLYVSLYCDQVETP